MEFMRFLYYVLLYHIFSFILSKQGNYIQPTVENQCCKYIKNSHNTYQNYVAIILLKVCPSIRICFSLATLYIIWYQSDTSIFLIDHVPSFLSCDSLFKRIFYSLIWKICYTAHSIFCFSNNSDHRNSFAAKNNQKESTKLSNLQSFPNKPSCLFFLSKSIHNTRTFKTLIIPISSSNIHVLSSSTDTECCFSS